MDIKDVFWKWRRAFRKRKDTIGRILNTTVVVLLLALVGYVMWFTYQSDLRREAIANAPKDENTIQAVKTKIADEPVFEKVAENANLILYADCTTGEISVEEKANGKVWLSNPTLEERKNDKKVTFVDTLRSQIYVKFVNLDAGVTQDMNSCNHSVKKGGLTYEKLADGNGIKFTYSFPIANVRIPVQYTLTEEGFKAEILTGEISGVGSNPFMIDNISLLPFFGAAYGPSADAETVADEGYLVVPDGSGALIQYNNDKGGKQPYRGTVYGKNPTMKQETQEPVRSSITLPVFGAKTNDHAFFAIITNGDATSTITAMTSYNDSAFNHVYANAVLREYELTQHDGDHLASQESHNIGYSKDLMEGENYAVEYFFLSGDDATYTGMSNFYRDYLAKNNKLKDSDLADKKYMVLDLIGAVSIEKYVVGIKKPVVTALTTYNDVIKIVDELKAKGVDNLVINYIGAMDSGLNNQMFNKVKPESVLGTKKEFQNMVNYLEQQGVILFIESNPVDLYENGNGYSENKDGAKALFDKYAFQYHYELDKGTSIKETRWHLLRPARVLELSSDFAQSMNEWGLGNISFARLGDTLYSDYSDHTEETGKDGNYIARTQSMKLWAQALENADQLTQRLMVHGGNAYCSAYADVVTDISNTHSNFEMEDQSIPFYQLVFHKNALLTSTGINTTVDYQYAFLKALETGCSLKYNLIYGDVSQLVGTTYNTMVSYSYSYWKDLAAEQYLEMQEAVGQLAGQEITDHTFITDDVTVTKYGTTEVVINYGLEPYTYNGQQIQPKDYVILTGGAV